MKVGIYSPYLDTLGGGERYVLTVAEVLSKGNEVKIFLDTHLQEFDVDKLKLQIKERFNLDLSRCEFIAAPFGKISHFFERLFFLQSYDLIIYVTDGSLFYSAAKKGYIHIQSPFPYKAGNNFWGKIKLSSWKGIIYNSNFTKKNAESSWGLNGRVIYPPVDIFEIKPYKKKKQILTVGRFFGYLKEKKHEVMIKAFKELSEAGNLEGWEFHLVGSCGEGDEPYLNELKGLAKGAPVRFHPNLSFIELVSLYGESSIYWHAMGFSESDPTKQEHFGITTVEAMAGGCVPVVIKEGGQEEIVEENKSGLFWEDVEELKDKTRKLVEDDKLMSELSKGAMDRSKLFSKEEFEKRIMELING